MPGGPGGHCSSSPRRQEWGLTANCLARPGTSASTGFYWEILPQWIKWKTDQPWASTCLCPPPPQKHTYIHAHENGKRKIRTNGILKLFCFANISLGWKKSSVFKVWLPFPDYNQVSVSSCLLFILFLMSSICHLWAQLNLLFVNLLNLLLFYY